jgi:hypothetical protein
VGWSELVRATANVLCVCALSAAAGACAAVPAALHGHAAERALAEESARRLAATGHGPERTYRLTLAAALLDKSREQAAKGRFQSALTLADEAERLVVEARRSGGGA